MSITSWWGEALLWMLEKQLGSDFTPAVKDAWTKLYELVANAMQRVSRADEAIE